MTISILIRIDTPNQIEYFYYKWKLKTALLVNYRRTSPDFKYINPDSWMPHSTTLSWYPIYGKCHTTYTDYQPRKVYIDISLCTWRWRRLHLIQYCNKYSIFSFFHCLSFSLSLSLSLSQPFVLSNRWFRGNSCTKIPPLLQG